MSEHTCVEVTSLPWASASHADWLHFFHSFCRDSKEINLVLWFPDITSLFRPEKYRHFYWGNHVKDCFQFGVFLLLMVKPRKIIQSILICRAWLLLLLFIAKAALKNVRPLNALERWQYSYLPNRALYKADVFLRMGFEVFVNIYKFS